MIEKQTVFVLGAGASVPYGYPTGMELRDSIIGLIDFDESNFKDTVTLSTSIAMIDNFDGISSQKLNQYLNLKNGLLGSKRSSIDTFLENRPKFCDIGKKCIAWNLIQCENTELTNKWDWFEHLHDQELARDCKSIEEYCQNNVDFITFNYDRLLEHSLFTSLKETYGENENYCAEIIKDSFNIIHVHGKLNDLPWESSYGRPYGLKPESRSEWEKESDGIKIIHEKIEEKSFREAHKLIENAEIIVFLGLNLHNITNLNRLNIKDNLEGKRIYATVKGLSGPQKNDISRYFDDRIMNLRNSPFREYDANELLIEEVRFRF